MIELNIKGMSCPHCVKAVSEALGTVPGVIRVVSVDLESGRTRVEGNADPQALVAAIRTAGYEAQAV